MSYPHGQQPPIPQYQQNGVPAQYQQNPYSGQPPSHHHSAVQMNQHQQGYQQGGVGYQQPYAANMGQDAAFFGSGKIAEDEQPAQFDRKKEIDALIVQGEPMYSEEDCRKLPELKSLRTGGYQDIWAAVLFLISIIGTIAGAAINGANGKVDFSSSSNSGGIDGEPLIVSLVKGAGVGVAFSIVFCVLMLFAMRAAPLGFIWFCNILFVLFMLGIAILGFVIGSTTLGVIGIILVLVTILWLYCVRHMIPFSALMLECSTHVTLNNFGCVGYALVTLVFSALYYFAWQVMVIPTLDNFNQGNNTNAAGGLSIVFIFMLFWFFYVMSNVAHVTSGGVMATWYFIGEKEMPASAASASFARAITTSFGSICFGSLITAILKTIEYIARAAMNRSRGGLAACICMCILSCIRRLMEYFNRLCFSFIAIFGCSYIDGAKLVFDLVMRQSIWQVLINDLLLERVFILVNLGQAAIAAVIVWFIFTNWVALIGAILGALGCGLIIFNVVDSGSVTLMVATATLPEVFPQQHPELSHKLREAISKLQQGGCCGGGDDESY